MGVMEQFNDLRLVAGKLILFAAKPNGSVSVAS